MDRKSGNLYGNFSSFCESILSLHYVGVDHNPFTFMHLLWHELNDSLKPHQIAILHYEFWWVIWHFFSSEEEPNIFSEKSYVLLCLNRWLIEFLGRKIIMDMWKKIKKFVSSQKKLCEMIIIWLFHIAFFAYLSVLFYS